MKQLGRKKQEKVNTSNGIINYNNNSLKARSPEEVLEILQENDIAFQHSQDVTVPYALEMSKDSSIALPL